MQISLFDTIPNGFERNIVDGKILRDAGIEKAITHANETNDNWSERAYRFLLDFIKTRNVFMCEDVRAASMRNVPEPPSKRAWGAIILKAAKSGMIIQSGYNKVKNANAHKANAAVWRVV